MWRDCNAKNATTYQIYVFWKVGYAFGEVPKIFQWLSVRGLKAKWEQNLCIDIPILSTLIHASAWKSLLCLGYIFSNKCLWYVLCIGKCITLIETVNYLMWVVRFVFVQWLWLIVAQCRRYLMLWRKLFCKQDSHQLIAFMQKTCCWLETGNLRKQSRILRSVADVASIVLSGYWCKTVAPDPAASLNCLLSSPTTFILSRCF